MPKCFKGSWISDADSLSRRPKLAAHIGIIVGLRERVEFELSVLLTSILKADAYSATILYSAITNDGAKRTAFNAAIEHFIEVGQQEEFFRVIEKSRKPLNRANRVIHALWGVSEQRPESLIWTDTRLQIRFNASLSLPFEGDNIQKKHEALRKHLRTATEYCEADFVAIQKRLHETIVAIAGLHSKLGAQYDPPVP